MMLPSGVVYQPESGGWEPHPFAEGLERRVLLSKNDHGAEISIFLLRVKPGCRNLEVGEHLHETSDDIPYFLSGSCTVVVERSEERPMRAGDFIRIPKGARHRV